jgi:hypothetical protein
MSDYSPQQRLDRYRKEMLQRIVERLVYIAVLFYFMAVYTLPLFEAHPTGKGLFSAIILVPFILASGDGYELVSNWIEARLFCPKYDKASQPRPEFTVDPNRLDVFVVRAWTYVFVAPLLPTAALVTLCYCGMLEIPYPIANSWLEALIMTIGLGVLRVYGWQVTSLRAWLKPFKRVPSPDVN